MCWAWENIGFDSGLSRSSVDYVNLLKTIQTDPAAKSYEFFVLLSGLSRKVGTGCWLLFWLSLEILWNLPSVRRLLVLCQSEHVQGQME